ncbi:MAG: Xaa-Pro peptidase family protein [Eubacteriales bacterium]|nr:Xaa-Pro peptidase family protein [Eubacteriales bacterium]
MMFEKAEYMERLAKVKKSMEEKGIDVLLVTNPANMCYLTGHNAWSFYVHQIVVVALDEEMPYFIGRYMDAFAGVVKTTYLDEKHVFAYPDYYVQNPECHPMDFMSAVLVDLGYGNKTIGVEMDSYYFTAMALERFKLGLPNAKFVNGDLIVNWVKIIKSDKEIELIRKAGIVVDAAMQAGVDALEPGARQCDVAGAIIGTQARGTDEVGGDYASIMPLMPYGETAGAPHLTWNDQPYDNDTSIFIEIAGVHQRYHCPMSRTVAIGKAPKKIYDYSKYTIEGLMAALDQVKPGNTCEAVEGAWRTTMKKYGVEKESRIGYSTGLNFPPDWGEHTASLRPGDKTILQPNMVFHCIPGMYYDDFGISISQCIRVTDTGYERMSHYPFDLIQK